MSINYFFCVLQKHHVQNFNNVIETFLKKSFFDKKKKTNGRMNGNQYNDKCLLKEKI